MTPRAHSLPSEQRRAVIVETTVALAAEQNPRDITTAAIARRMNLTQGALFRHFASKDAIYQAVMEWVLDRLLARVDGAIGGAGTSLAALEAVFDAHLEFVTAHPGVPRLLFGELQRPEDTAAKRVARTLLQRYGARLVEVIEAGRARGEIAPDVDAAGAATLFLGAIQGLVIQSLLGGGAPPHAAAHGPFAILRRGLEPRT